MNFNRQFLIIVTLIASFGVLTQSTGSPDSQLIDIASVNNYRDITGLGKPSDDQVIVGISNVQRYQVQNNPVAPTPSATSSSNLTDSNKPNLSKPARALTHLATISVPVRRLEIIKSHWIPGKPVYLRDRVINSIKQTNVDSEVQQKVDEVSMELAEDFNRIADKGKASGLDGDKGLII